MKNGDKPITPLRGAQNVLFNSSGIDSEYIEKCQPLIGLTKREYFAAMAMQGILSNTTLRIPTEIASHEAVQYANALLSELEKSN